jgi:phosphoribosylanthranilate isomerase
MIKVKIDGLTTPEAVDAAVSGGAAFIGFVFFAASPRDIAPEAAARLAERARGKAAIVAVTVDPDDVLIDRLRVTLRPDFVQLHGREVPSRVREVAERSAGGVIKALPVAVAADVDRAADYEAVAEHLLFDARPSPDADRPGGGGASFDWSVLSGRRFVRPWFLAGGLDPWNLAEAVRVSGAPMADVSSGVERGAGLKDPALIRAFLEAARRA